MAVPVIVRAATNPEFAGQVAQFHEHWERFLRAYLGCPKGAIDIRQCDGARGVLDYPEFLKAARIGRKLFENV